MLNGNSDEVQSQRRPLKPGGLAGTRKIPFASNLMEMLVELPNKFRRHSASGMVADKIFQPAFLAGHQIYKFYAIDILK